MKWQCTICGYIHEGDDAPDACPICGAPKTDFILIEKLSATIEKILKDAFAGESKAHVRNLAFARKADEEGYSEIAKLFRAVAAAEKIHANEYLKFLEGVIQSTEENLQTAFENENKAKVDYYPVFIKKASEENRKDVASSFARARDVEERHANLYKEALNALASDEVMEYHVCTVCGYVFSGALPDQCPVCQASKELFIKTD